MEYPEYRHRLREERKRLGLTQDEFAAALSLSRQTIVFYENGKSLPDMASLDEMGKMGADVLYLLTGQRRKEAVFEHFDWELHEGIVKGIHAWADENQLQIPPEKQAMLIRLLYEKFSKSQKVEEATMRQILKLVA